MKFPFVPVLLATLLPNIAHSIYPPEPDRLDSQAQNPNDPAYLPLMTKSKTGMTTKLILPPRSLCQADFPLPSPLEKDGMALANGSHILVSQADAGKLLTGEDGLPLARGPLGSPVNPQDFDAMNNQVGAAL